MATEMVNIWTVVGKVIRAESSTREATAEKKAATFLNVEIETVGETVSLDLYGKPGAELSKYPIGAEIKVWGRPRASVQGLKMVPAGVQVVKAQPSGSGAEAPAEKKVA